MKFGIGALSVRGLNKRKHDKFIDVYDSKLFVFFSKRFVESLAHTRTLQIICYLLNGVHMKISCTQDLHMVTSKLSCVQKLIKLLS